MNIVVIKHGTATHNYSEGEGYHPIGIKGRDGDIICGHVDKDIWYPHPMPITIEKTEDSNMEFYHIIIPEKLPGENYFIALVQPFTVDQIVAVTPLYIPESLQFQQVVWDTTYHRLAKEA